MGDLNWCGPFAGKDDKVVDHNQWMCYGIKNRRHYTCRSEITVKKEICSSGYAVLADYKGDGSRGSYIDANGCHYWFYAEYKCGPHVEEEPLSALTSYWDHGWCGPFAGEDDGVVDHNQWMCYGIKNRRYKTCKEEVTVPTDTCPSGKAHLDFYRGDGSKDSYIDDNGCKY